MLSAYGIKTQDFPISVARKVSGNRLKIIYVHANILGVCYGNDVRKLIYTLLKQLNK